MTGEPLKSWVAFDADGFPIGFATPDHTTMAKFAKECGPGAVRIELVEGKERSRLLYQHAGLPWPPADE